MAKKTTKKKTAKTKGPSKPKASKALKPLGPDECVTLALDLCRRIEAVEDRIEFTKYNTKLVIGTAGTEADLMAKVLQQIDAARAGLSEIPELIHGWGSDEEDKDWEGD